MNKSEDLDVSSFDNYKLLKDSGVFAYKRSMYEHFGKIEPLIYLGDDVDGYSYIFRGSRVFNWMPKILFESLFIKIDK